MVTLPPLAYLAIDGTGDPNTSTSYREAIETLYPLAYKLKFFSKNEFGRDYGVPPLEALWWSDDMAAFTTARDKSRWSWTALILLPSWLDVSHVETASAVMAGKAPALDRLQVRGLDEGLVVQTLHVGSYDDEAPVLATMHGEVIPAQDLTPTGKHHEIYLSDARRTAPEKLRTILRQPVARVGSGA